MDASLLKKCFLFQIQYVSGDLTVGCEETLTDYNITEGWLNHTYNKSLEVNSNVLLNVQPVGVCYVTIICISD